MPVGTVAKNTERYELKTLAEAYVVIRRMSYGEKLDRQDDMVSLSMKDKDAGMSIGVMGKRMALKDFGNLVVEHNITDEKERILNFKDAKDVVALDPRVGDEISQYIDEINTFEESADIKN